MIDIVDDGRIRTITFRRPEAKNAMNTEIWDGTTEAFLAGVLGRPTQRESSPPILCDPSRCARNDRC